MKRIINQELKDLNVITQDNGTFTTEELKKALKENTITIEDIHLCGLMEIKKTVEDIKKYFNSQNMEFLTDCIYYRTPFEMMLKEISDHNPNIYTCIDYLKQYGYIECCGIGYIFTDFDVEISFFQNMQYTAIYHLVKNIA